MTGSTASTTTKRGGILTRSLAHLRSNVVAYLALFFALGGASAMAAGTIGSSQLKPIIVNESAFVNVPTGTSSPAFMTCPRGHRFISGAAGFVGASSGDDTRVASTQFVGAPGHQPTGYLAYGYNNTGTTRQFYVQVACLGT
jgi:hypothetical protein